MKLISIPGISACAFMISYEYITIVVFHRNLSKKHLISCKYLLKARTVEPEKHTVLLNVCLTRSNGVTVGSGVFCAVRTEAI
jgi:hypothetical protein